MSEAARAGWSALPPKAGICLRIQVSIWLPVLGVHCSDNIPTSASGCCCRCGYIG